MYFADKNNRSIFSTRKLMRLEEINWIKRELCGYFAFVSTLVSITCNPFLYYFKLNNTIKIQFKLINERLLRPSRDAAVPKYIVPKIALVKFVVKLWFCYNCESIYLEIPIAVFNHFKPMLYLQYEETRLSIFSFKILETPVEESHFC